MNHDHDGLAAWHADHGVTSSSDSGVSAEPEWELHNLTTDPEERRNLSRAAVGTMRDMQAILEGQRDEKRLLPSSPR